LLPQSKVFEDEILSGPKNTHSPTEEMPEPHDHCQESYRIPASRSFRQIIDSTMTARISDWARERRGAELAAGAVVASFLTIALGGLHHRYDRAA
jgi:hypothetical protein